MRDFLTGAGAAAVGFAVFFFVAWLVDKETR